MRRGKASESSYLLLLVPLLLILAGQSCAKIAGIYFGPEELRAESVLLRLPSTRSLQNRSLGLIFAVGTYLFFGLRGAVWAVIVKRMKLSVAYPVLSLSFPLVLLLSHFLFGESISGYNLAGALIVLSGLLIIARGELRLRAERERKPENLQGASETMRTPGPAEPPASGGDGGAE